MGLTIPERLLALRRPVCKADSAAPEKSSAVACRRDSRHAEIDGWLAAGAALGEFRRRRGESGSQRLERVENDLEERSTFVAGVEPFARRGSAGQRGAVGPSLALACGGEYVIDDEAYEAADRGRTAT